jgi:hypothetical protein
MDGQFFQDSTMICQLNSKSKHGLEPTESRPTYNPQLQDFIEIVETVFVSVGKRKTRFLNGIEGLLIDMADILLFC